MLWGLGERRRTTSHRLWTEERRLMVQKQQPCKAEPSKSSFSCLVPSPGQPRGPILLCLPASSLLQFSTDLSESLSWRWMAANTGTPSNPRLPCVCWAAAQGQPLISPKYLASSYRGTQGAERESWMTAAQKPPCQTAARGESLHGLAGFFPPLSPAQNVVGGGGFWPG